MTTLKTRHVPTCSTTPYFEIEPDNGKPPLLLLHGFLMSGAIWQDNISHLSQTARCIRMELFGHNRSPSPDAPESYHPDHYFECLETLRQELGYDRWSICGHSLGAALGLSYALAYPASVDAVIFTNSRSALADRRETESAPLPADFEKRLVDGGVSGLSDLCAHPNRMRYVPSHTREMLIADSNRHDPRGIARTIQFTAPHVNVRNRFHKLSCSVLLVNGTRERRFQPLKQWASSARTGMKVVDLDGGHSVNAEAAPDFNRVAAEFLKDVNQQDRTVQYREDRS